MHDLLNNAALTLQQKNVIEAIGEEEFIEDCLFDETDDITDEELISDLDLDQTLEIDTFDLENVVYLSDDLDLNDFVEEILSTCGVTSDEIDDYLCETEIEDSFLNTFEDDGVTEFSIDKEKLLEFLRDFYA